MKKSNILSFYLALFVFLSFADVGQAASASPANFEQRKAQQLKRVDQRIAHLQDEKSCIAAATTQDAITTCRERFKQGKRQRLQ